MNNYGTHQRLLVRAALRTTGPILELGCGWYSTPLLHEIAACQDRFLVTHDNDPEWMRRFWHTFSDENHVVEMLDRSQWSRRLENVSTRWGLVLVDHGPTPETPRNHRGLLNALDRGQAVLDLMDRTDVFVLHDTEPGVRWEYDWDRVLPLFKYSFTDKTLPVHTTVLSNVIDVGGREWTGQ